MKDAAELKSHVYDIVGALHSVHDELGPGINEYCYQEALAMELSDRGIPFEREKAFHPRYKGRPMDAEYRIDFLCKGDVIVVSLFNETYLHLHSRAKRGRDSSTVALAKVDSPRTSLKVVFTSCSGCFQTSEGSAVNYADAPRSAGRVCLARGRKFGYNVRMKSSAISDTWSKGKAVQPCTQY